MTPDLILGLFALSFLAVGVVLGLGDSTYRLTKALPNGAATIVTDGIDLETSTGEFIAPVEFEVIAPALTTGELADTQTITYSIETATDLAFTSPVVLMASFLVQTGAGGAGAVTATKRFTVPTNVLRFIRVKAVKAGASNASTKSVTFNLLQLM